MTFAKKFSRLYVNICMCHRCLRCVGQIIRLRNTYIYVPTSYSSFQSVLKRWAMVGWLTRYGWRKTCLSFRDPEYETALQLRSESLIIDIYLTASEQWCALMSPPCKITASFKDDHDLPHHYWYHLSQRLISREGMKLFAWSWSSSITL